ncbi:MAG: tRNA (N(6)-L-threonylcarbamoyladenosine(37)-C(2))-methylthiotransferase MtaB [Spirochaetes bacterium]|nr:tRNA (N(6)-L-threonylcarbamoyladenosine(37)-C(2))-methylthiotransferase MtaB [Spirochaetota bacterium]
MEPENPSVVADISGFYNQVANNIHSMTKTFSIKTLGCKLNQYESSLIAGQFLDNGWISKPFGEPVDVVIINTCTVTNKSDKKCRNYIRQSSKFLKSGKIIVTGCLAERDGESLKKIPGVFAVTGNSGKHKIYDLISGFLNDRENSDAVLKDKHSIIRKKAEYPVPFYRTRGLIKIQDGCDGECSYCIVPKVRGIPVSRDYDEILNHAKMLVAEGTPELILTGITIGKFNSSNRSLADLINDICRIEGKFRIRISSIEPKHATNEFLDAVSSEKVCSHLHLPLQSGSDRILRLMKRPYAKDEFIKLVHDIKVRDDKLAIGTDLIIGFPGETNEDFEESLKMIQECEFSYVHQFTFSPRSGTPAADMIFSDSKEISERSLKMKEVASQAGLKYRERFVGLELPSIIEKNKKSELFTAVSDNYIKIIISDNIDEEFLGKIINIRLDTAGTDKNTGSVIL